MGFTAIAAQRVAAQMSRWSRSVSLPTPPFVKTKVDVITALDMEAAVRAAVQQQHIFVAQRRRESNYRAGLSPVKNQNRRRKVMNYLIKWSKTRTLSPGWPRSVTIDPMLLGFAAEANNVEEYARQKRIRKP